MLPLHQLQSFPELYPNARQQLEEAALYYSALCIAYITYYPHLEDSRRRQWVEKNNLSEEQFMQAAIEVNSLHMERKAWPG